ncbi:TrbC/VirB2 family protein [Paralysiella testudinis]|uniref:Uncharacterized protein n=1 Tax=Paralysiella testudinis TaxID=2809020 RepID=A0A892ZK40_9NEIS|nr:TrbC/VirB2 family protein [Paralysiella testudinis]QRQ82825.1 hypothetical protein JQU52_05435 [Paralysiella testudinis]QRQ82993.1 hypothetical protein JQU52_06370 [Paralysiella testudinis]
MRTLKNTRDWVQALLLCSLLGFANMALAAGFDEVSDMAKTVRTAVYALVGVVAGLCLLWQFVQGFGGRKTWTDILETSAWIVGAGAAIAFATWLFTKGGSMSF